MTATYAKPRGFTVDRLLNAPRPLVWRCWTEPELLTWFLNPGHPTDVPITVDLRVGGAFRVGMIVNDATRYITGGIYREIVPIERLVFAWGAAGGWPLLDGPLDDALQATIELHDLGAQTRMAARLSLPDHLTQEEVQKWLDIGIQPGWTGTLERLVQRFA